MLSTVTPLLWTDDYNIPSTTSLTLTSTRNRTCMNVSIIDDRLVEGNETFSMSLRVSDTGDSRDQVKLGMTNMTTVTIVDDDGMYRMSTCMKGYTQHVM